MSSDTESVRLCPASDIKAKLPERIPITNSKRVKAELRKRLNLRLLFIVDVSWLCVVLIRNNVHFL